MPKDKKKDETLKPPAKKKGVLDWMEQFDPVACFGDLLSGKIFEVTDGNDNVVPTTEGKDSSTGDDTSDDKPSGKQHFTINNIFRTPKSDGTKRLAGKQKEGAPAGEPKPPEGDS